MMNSRREFIGPCNIGNPQEYTMLQLANKTIELTKSRSRIIHMPLPQDDPMQRRPVIEMAKDELKWIPKIQLEEGLIKTINYFKTYISM